MSVRKISLVLLAVLSLSACASYSFSKKDYGAFAYAWAGAMQCPKSGYMDSATADKGIQIMRQRLATATYDQDSLSQAVNKAMKGPFATVACEEVAGIIQGWDSQMTQQQQRNPATSGSYEAGKAFTDVMPKQTICNRVGTQMFCSTY